MARHTTIDLSTKWSERGAGTHYANGRWRGARARERDARLISRLLASYAGAERFGTLLDAPCGTGRLQAFLSARCARYVGLDLSAEMLAQMSACSLQGSAWRLPFMDASFDAVVCCRLLHHVADDARRLDLLRELVRVTRGLLAISFWDARSLHAWRRRYGLRKRARHADERVAISKPALTTLLEQAGAEVLGYAHSFRLVSQQSFVLVRRRNEAHDV